MTEAVASSPGKVILFGEHGVHRGQANITTAVDLRTWCRVTVRPDSGYSLASGALCEEGSRERLAAFKAQVDALREANTLSELAALTKDFFVPARTSWPPWPITHRSQGSTLSGVRRRRSGRGSAQVPPPLPRWSWPRPRRRG